MSEAHTALNVARAEKVVTLQVKKRDLEEPIRVMKREISRGTEFPESELKKLGRWEATVAVLDAELATMRNTPPTTNLPVETLSEFIVDSKGDFADADVSVTLAKGQNPADAVEAARNRREALVSEKRGVRNQLLPIDDAIARLVADVDAHAEALDFGAIVKLRPQLRSQAWSSSERPDAQGHLELPTRQVAMDGGRLIELDQSHGLICWLMRDALIERGKEELAKLYAGRAGLSIEERAARIAELDAEILDAERAEEAFIRLAEAAGTNIRRRPLANPLAVLGIKPKVV
jgi:hypothetical protein